MVKAIFIRGYCFTIRCSMLLDIIATLANFVANQWCMVDIKMTLDEWEVAKAKFRRKYNHLSDEDLAFEPGKEDELVNRLAKRVKRTPDYVLYTLKKGIAQKETNRL